MTIVRRSRPTAQALGALASLDPLVARLYAAREVRTIGEAELRLSRLSTFDGLLGIEGAVDLLVEVLRGGKRVLVVGDFDADGATSTAVALRALRAFGADDVDYLVPNRFEFGYGLTPEIVDIASTRSPDLIITVDNGISSVEGVARARSLGIKVIVTDHHLPGAELPDADAIVNPNQRGDNSSLGGLAGVGVLFYVMLALRARLREEGWFNSRSAPNLGVLLDLVAMGTVADVAPFDSNNRILVAQGLERLRRGEGCAGLRALLRVSGRPAKYVSASDLAFAVAPRLNAAGRLADMSTGIECLLSDDAHEAFMWAEQLDGLNRTRRDIEQTMTREAEEQVEALCFDAEALPSGLCLFEEQWHPGIVGIIASRVKDKFHRPVIAFAPEGVDNLKGSARSIPDLHIRDSIEAVATRLPGIVRRFGGHAMAAGLTLSRHGFNQFSAAFSEHVAGRVNESALNRVWLSDGELQLEQLTLATALKLQEAGPWGQGFPEPVFDGYFDVEAKRTVGGKHTRLDLRVAGRDTAGGKPIEAIAFNIAADRFPDKSLHLVYRLDVNRFRGIERVQLIVEHIQVADVESL